MLRSNAAAETCARLYPLYPAPWSLPQSAVTPAGGLVIDKEQRGCPRQRQGLSTNNRLSMHTAETQRCGLWRVAGSRCVAGARYQTIF